MQTRMRAHTQQIVSKNYITLFCWKIVFFLSHSDQVMHQWTQNDGMADIFPRINITFPASF